MVKFINYIRKVCIISSLFIFLSCSSSIKGKIDYRNDNNDCYGFNQKIDHAIETDEYRDKDSETKSAYLINESIDKTYEFTIKEVETIDDTIINYHTIKIKLLPGDEKWLGCTKFLNGEKYYTKEIIDTFYREDAKNYSITDIVTINKRNVDDTTKPKKRSVVEIKYSCTGQRLITDANELDDN
jgi:hypothetical protein